MKKYKKLITITRTIRNLLIIALLIGYCIVNTKLSILIVVCVLALMGDLLRLIPKKVPHLYLRLYRGRTYPQFPPNEENEMGPLIGPIEITWVFGELLIHDPENMDDPVTLPITKKGHLVLFEGIYYSDFEILAANSPEVKQYREDKERFLTYKEFANNQTIQS